jgi:type II secretory pathway pseudopilin PulG
MKEEQVQKKSSGGAALFVAFLIILIISAAFAGALFCYMDKTKDADAFVEAGEIYIGAQSHIYALGEDGVRSGTYSTADRIKSNYPKLEKSLEALIGEEFSGEITSITVDPYGTITAMEYTAQNGKALIFDGLAWEVDRTKKPVELPEEAETNVSAEKR